MREDLRRTTTMIYVTAGVSLFLFVYLFAALIRPEWF
ncbi:MAG TPA: K(+)-transporting ATPase subunit F [Candidatus Kryptonia bacterium]|nr:K(+)-transporting ATPase subunit F [Candidatus Kryptonia bacterium]